MVRTDTVTLTSIPATAYRQKLPAGGSGIVIMREGASQPGIASISKTSGEAIPTDNTPSDLYPMAAFQEAIKLTAGMPYKKRGGVRLNKKKVVETAPQAAEDSAEDVVIDSGEYQKLVDQYTDKNGKLSYELLNHDLIRFAHSSKVVGKMLADGVNVKKTRTYIVCSKFRTVIGNKKLTEDEILKMADLLDEVSPKSVFKAIDSELRKMSAAKKQK